MKKVDKNDPCLCGNVKKYKHCCLNNVDWNKIIENREDWIPYLSIRGRNILFYEKIAEALQLDRDDKTISIGEYKKAFTAEAVKKIHEALIEVWPINTNISNVLNKTSCDISGLYIGDYGIEYLYKGIVRHSMYANKILIVDPFVYPYSIKDEYNPILNPEQYRTQTLRNVNLWTTLIPWVKAGIVELIRPPNNFDPQLHRNSLIKQRKKFSESKELQEALKKSTSKLGERYTEQEKFRDLILSTPNAFLEKYYKKFNLDKKGITFKQFITDIEEMREADPDFLEPFKVGEESSEIHVFSTGLNYDIAKLTAEHTGSYLVTDLSSKWKEIELDRENHSAENNVWAPLAKAFQELELKFLNNLNIDDALKLREEERLESLRVFLRKIWKSACTTEPFTDINAKLLADELKDEVKNAEKEWEGIDRDLVKWAGVELVGGLLSAGPMIASGHAAFLAAAMTTAGVVNLGVAHSKRKSFPDKFPAAFFMNLKKS